MNAPKRNLVRSAVFLAAVCGITAAGAQEETVPRAGRISRAEGHLVVRSPDDEDWIETGVNGPVFAEDTVCTGIDGIAEIEIGDETAIRAGLETCIEIAALDDSATALMLPQGGLWVHAPRVDYFRPPLEIQGAAFSLVADGHATFRVSVHDSGDMELQVRDGALTLLVGGDRGRRIDGGTGVVVFGNATRQFEFLSYAPDRDFDRWSDERDARAAAAVSGDYVSARVAGYWDLDDQGDWVVLTEYGRAWRPRVIGADWAPYRLGRWIWRAPCGWVWVSDEPWGWVPYHYGRWFWVERHGWCWTPLDVAPVVARPVWSPALVVFTRISDVSACRVTFAGGRTPGPCIGWFPLAPSDPHRPWHLRSRNGRDARAYRDIPPTRSSYGADRHVYRNQHVRNAVTVAPKHDFALGRFGNRGTATLAPRGSNDAGTGWETLPGPPARPVRAAAGKPVGRIRLDARPDRPVEHGAGPSMNREIPRSNDRPSAPFAESAFRRAGVAAATSRESPVRSVIRSQGSVHGSAGGSTRHASPASESPARSPRVAVPRQETAPPSQQTISREAPRVDREPRQPPSHQPTAPQRLPVRPPPARPSHRTGDSAGATLPGISLRSSRPPVVGPRERDPAPRSDGERGPPRRVADVPSGLSRLPGLSLRGSTPPRNPQPPAIGRGLPGPAHPESAGRRCQPRNAQEARVPGPSAGQQDRGPRFPP